MQKDQVNAWKDFLTRIYSPEGNERCGVLTDLQIVELENCSPTPHAGFDISGNDTLAWFDKAKATWHTHPGMPSNLGGEDYQMFTEWKDLYHFIVGCDGVRCYKYDREKQALMEVE